MTETYNTAGKDRPQFFFLKPPFLYFPFRYLIIQCSLRVFKKRIKLINSCTVLLFGIEQVILQIHHILIPSPLLFHLFQLVHHPLALAAIIEAKQAQKKLFFCLAMLQIEKCIIFIALNDDIILHKDIEIILGTADPHIFLN